MFFIPSVKFWLEFYAVMCEYSYFLFWSLVSLSVFSYALTFNLSFSVRWICLDKEGLNLTLTSLISLCLNCDVNIYIVVCYVTESLAQISPFIVVFAVILDYLYYSLVDKRLAFGALRKLYLSSFVSDSFIHLLQ